MKLTTNYKVLQKRIDASGLKLDGEAVLKQFGGYALINDRGFMLYIKSGPKLYKVSGGLVSAQAQNKAHRWMFEKTDAERVVACWPEGSGLTKTVSLVRGGKIDKVEGGMVYASITRARWEKAAS